MGKSLPLPGTGLAEGRHGRGPAGEPARSCTSGTFARADEASGLPIRQYSLEGPIETLTRDRTSRSRRLFALSSRVAEIAREAGVQPDFVAGHSLGEYTAAVGVRRLSA